MRSGLATEIGAAGAGGAAEAWYLSGGISAVNCIAAYLAKGAASYAASKSNLANPGTYDAAEGVAPSWASGTGWTFNGSTQYLATGGIAPGDGWSMIVRLANGAVTTGSNVCGCTVTGSRFYLRPCRTPANHLYGYGDAVNQPAGKVTDGVLCMAGTNCYLDGVADGTAGSWASAPGDILLGCTEENGSPLRFWAGDIVAFAVYDTTISGAQVSAVTTAMEEF